MARPLRIEYEGAWYHVINRGQTRRNIVRTDEDRKLFLKLLGDTQQTYGIEIHAFSLMDNHYHLLVHTPKAGLSRAMRHLNGVYTLKINQIWNTDGPIFKGRYNARLVDSEEYLLELIRYIHLNPVVAKLCAKAQDHQWTSHGYYIDRKRRPTWLSTQQILSRFGGAERTALERLDKFVHEGVPVWFSEEIKRNRIVLGRECFRDWVYHNYVDPDRDDILLGEKKPWQRISIKKILEKVSFVYDVPISEIRKARQGKQNEARTVAVYLARQISGARQVDLVKWFNATNRYAIAKMIQRFKEVQAKDKNLNRIMNGIKSHLYSQRQNQ